MITKYLNSLTSFKSVVTLLIVVYSTLFAHFYSQNIETSGKDNCSLILLEKGAVIYSSDESFNQQILTQKIVIKNANLKCKYQFDRQQILVLSSREFPNNELENQVKLSERKKQNEILTKTRKEVDKFERRLCSFAIVNFNNLPSPNHFSSSNPNQKNYLRPNRTDSVSTILYNAAMVSSMQALDFLHSQKHNYTNKSLNFSFEKAFSVRPPPYFFIFLSFLGLF